MSDFESKYVLRREYDALSARVAAAEDALNIVTIIDERLGKGWTRELAHALFPHIEGLGVSNRAPK